MKQQVNLIRQEVSDALEELVQLLDRPVLTKSIDFARFRKLGLIANGDNGGRCGQSPQDHREDAFVRIIFRRHDPAFLNSLPFDCFRFPKIIKRRSHSTRLCFIFFGMNHGKRKEGFHRQGVVGKQNVF